MAGVFGLDTDIASQIASILQQLAQVQERQDLQGEAFRIITDWVLASLTQIINSLVGDTLAMGLQSIPYVGGALATIVRGITNSAFSFNAPKVSRYL